MAARADKTVWVLVLVAAGIGSGLLGRYPFGTHADGLLPGLLFAGGVLVLGLPLLLAEAALGQARRRNVVDALGPGPWALGGWLGVAGSLVLAAVLAVVAAWAALLAYGSFQGDYFDDHARHLRLITQGWDTLLLALAALAIATGLAMANVERGLRGTLGAVAIVALVAAGGVLLYGLVATGTADREAAWAVDLDDFDGALLVAALQQALVPGLLGLGVVATLTGHIHDRTLPREASILAILWVLVPLAIGFGLSALAHDEGLGLGSGVGLAGPATLFAGIGGTAGGILSGTFFGLLLAGCLAALVALLEVPATVLSQRNEGWDEGRAFLASGLGAYLLAIPLCFVAGLALDLELVLTAFVAPLGGLVLCLHVGWARPDVLDGFLVGDAHHHLDRFLRPLLRFVLPLPLAGLLVLGVLRVATHVFGAELGSGWLADLVP